MTRSLHLLAVLTWAAAALLPIAFGSLRVVLMPDGAVHIGMSSGSGHSAQAAVAAAPSALSTQQQPSERPVTDQAPSASQQAQIAALQAELAETKVTDFVSQCA
jgi:hypothetical protein